MSFLVPSAFWLLLLVAPLLWLWRFQQARRTVIIPSLAPFRHLREHVPKAHWVRVNLLLLLQLLLLCTLIGALAKPRLHGKFTRPHRTIIAVLDNSASMRAATGGTTAFQRARAEVLRVAGDLSVHDRLALVATAPPQLVTSPWVSGAAAARAAVSRVQVTDAPGDLAGAIHLAQSLAADQRMHRFIIATDEAAPAGALPPSVEWHAVGRPLPNVALTQFELSGALAANTPLSATVEVINFADVEQTAEVTLMNSTVAVANHRMQLAPFERKSVVLGPFTLQAAESLTATVRASRDALSADNVSTIAHHGSASTPLVLEGITPAFRSVIERLVRNTTTLSLDPNPTSSETGGGAGATPIRVITGVPGATPQAPTLYLWPIEKRQSLQPVRVVDWDAAHAVTRYLTSVDRVPLMRARDVGWPAWARVVVWGSDGKQSLPLVGVGERAGFREVITAISWDEINFQDPRAVELLVLFLNICEWLAPSNHTLRAATGEALTAPFVPPGEIGVTLPTGEVRHMRHSGGAWEFADTWWAGTYVVASAGGPQTGGGRWQFHAALRDERESNVLELSSRLPQGLWSEAATPAPAPASPRPMERWLWWAAACLFLAEWMVYQRRVMARSAA